MNILFPQPYAVGRGKKGGGGEGAVWLGYLTPQVGGEGGVDASVQQEAEHNLQPSRGGAQVPGQSSEQL